MSVPIMSQARHVLDALNEGTVATVIRLHETGVIGSDPAKTPRQNIFNTLTEPKRGMNMEPDEANYWLDFFRVTND